MFNGRGDAQTPDSVCSVHCIGYNRCQGPAMVAGVRQLMTTLNRRRFIKSAAAGSLALSMKAAAKAADRKPSSIGAAPEGKADVGLQPDILIIMPDQWRGDCLSSLNHPVVKTPHLDKLAQDGTLFRRAYTTVTSCIPARHAFLTGMFPQTSGIVGFKHRTLRAAPFPELLHRAGYTTAIVGKDQHQNKESGDCGYKISIIGTIVRDVSQYDQDLKKVDPRYQNIEQVINRMGVTRNHWQATSWSLKDEIHPVEWTARRSRDVVKNADPGKPLYLHASFNSPHPPLFPLKKYFDKYKNSDLPDFARGDWVNWKKLPVNKLVRSGHRVLLEGDTLTDAQAGYYGLMEQIDTSLAPLIAEFKDRSKKAKRPWVIIVTSDHGEMMGDHGYFRKCEPYEGAANIPYIISGAPELRFKSNVVSYEPVCLEDIMPTLLEAASLKIPAYVDGTSLLKTLRGKTAEVRDILHFEHATCYSKAQGYHALTDGRYKYIWRPATGQEQLFDLRNDIKELHDLSGNPKKSTMLETWRQRLVKRLEPRPEGFSKQGKLIPGRRYPALNPGVKKS